MQAEGYTEVLEYFEKKASRYDEVDAQVYWRLSDELLWDLFKTYVLDVQTNGFSFLDAGGGTGRWTKRILDSRSDARGSLIDLSDAMLEQARRKFCSPAYAARTTLERGNLEALDGVADGTFDVVFNFHNVLGFVQNPQKALSELSRVTRSGGFVVSVVPNENHVVFFNLLLGRVAEAEHATATAQGRFTTDMPYMHIFTVDAMKALYSSVGLEALPLGFPVSIFPGFQETQISGSTSRLEEILGNPEYFERILTIERKLCRASTSAARGNNLMMIARKR